MSNSHVCMIVSNLFFLISVCSNPTNPWLCLFCGLVHCGRYVNGHARDHSMKMKQHCVCMDVENHSVFW